MWKSHHGSAACCGGGGSIAYRRSAAAGSPCRWFYAGRCGGRCCAVAAAQHQALESAPFSSKDTFIHENNNWDDHLLCILHWRFKSSKDEISTGLEAMKIEVIRGNVLLQSVYPFEVIIRSMLHSVYPRP